MASGEFNLDNPVMRDFVFYAVFVVLKMCLMAPLTARARIANKVFANPEDAAGGGKVQTGFEPVERVRRNHLNDIENIVPFVVIGFCYVLISPAPTTALLLFRVFAASRVFHTLAYQIPIPQPSRALAFFVGFGINMYMGICCLMRCY